MGKKSWWLHLLKNLISCESKPKVKKRKTRSWKWIFSGFRLKQLPTTENLQEKSLSEARDEQRQHALNVARATAAAAEAAVAAAQAAAEVVRLTRVSRHSSLRQQDKEIENLAAIRIQTAYRAYLARKALRALKGLVRIQAIVRGRAVRRRMSTQLKHLKCVHPTQIVHTKTPILIDQSPCTKSDIGSRSKLECKSQRQWTDSLFSKQEIETIYMRKQEAFSRRERMKQYSFSHRERQCSHILEETMPLRHEERQTCSRKQSTKDDIHDKTVYTRTNILDFHPNINNWDLRSDLKIKPRVITLPNPDFTEESNSPFSHPRRSFGHLRLKQGSDECHHLSNSCVFPAYMAVTESAKAKMRSMSTPRQRLGYLDTCFEQYGSPCKSSWSSFNGECSSFGRIQFS